MRRRKYKRYKYHRRLMKRLRLLEERYAPKKIEPSKIETNEILVTEVDKMTHIRRVDSQRTILEVVNVSYEAKIGDEWITIVRYDSAHGFLHRHLRVSLDDPKEIINTTGVKKRGTTHVWYTWAIKDILSKYTDYKKGFLKRSKGV